MPQVKVSRTFEASADTVWGRIGGFNALPEWHPAVAGSALEDGGRQRRLTLGDGAQILEEERSRDEAGRSYTYAILDSPLPVANYVATLRVTPSGGGCEAEWSSTFDAVGPEDEAADVVRGIYEAGFDHLKTRL